MATKREHRWSYLIIQNKDIEIKSIKRDKERLYIMIKKSIHQDEKTITNIQLTLRQHGFESCRSIHTQIFFFNKYTARPLCLHPRIQQTQPWTEISIHSWFSLQRWNLWIQRVDCINCTMAFYIRNLSTHRFWNIWELVDTEGWLYMHQHQRNQIYETNIDRIEGKSRNMIIQTDLNTLVSKMGKSSRMKINKK